MITYSDSLLLREILNAVAIYFCSTQTRSPWECELLSCRHVSRLLRVGFITHRQKHHIEVNQSFEALYLGAALYHRHVFL